MAERLAIMGGESYAEWIEWDGTAQRMFKAYCDKWPDGTAQCVAIGDEFYVRSHGGGMRRVDSAADFEDESKWCSYCGTPIDAESCEYYICDVFYCDAALCEDCGGCGNDCYCARHRINGMFSAGKDCEYTYPYAHGHGDRLTFGVEIEIESELDADFAENVTNSDLIAGWDKDPSLGEDGVELQTNILDMSKLPALRRIVEGIPCYGENAGGHIHVSRTPNQCASRWYWALRGLDATQCERLNMRHLSDDYWCALSHGDYVGKHTAVNAEHQDTIELRTFDCWYGGSADKLIPAVKWIRAMWRFFEKHPRGTVKADVIEQYSSCMANNVTDAPSLTLAERLVVARRVKADREAEEEWKRQARAAEIRRNVEANIRASRRARKSHSNTTAGTLEWDARQIHRTVRRDAIAGRLADTTSAYAFPSRDLRPLHTYLKMATAKVVEHGETFRGLDLFCVYHAAGGAVIWDSSGYSGRRYDTAQRVLNNIMRNRVARASHGRPTAESLERTALRLYKRAGRPELSARYVRIRKDIAATRDNS